MPLHAKNALKTLQNAVENASNMGAFLGRVESGCPCDSLDEKCPPWPDVFDAWSPVGGTVWEG